MSERNWLLAVYLSGAMTALAPAAGGQTNSESEPLVAVELQIIVGDVDDPAIITSMVTQNVKGYVHLQDASTQLVRTGEAVLQGDTFLPAPEDSGENEHVNP